MPGYPVSTRTLEPVIAFLDLSVGDVGVRARWTFVWADLDEHHQRLALESWSARPQLGEEPCATCLFVRHVGEAREECPGR